MAANPSLPAQAAGASLPDVDVERLLDDLPAKWERLEDLALVPASAFSGAEWLAAIALLPGGAGALWRAVAGALGVARLARQAPVANTGT